MIKEFVPYELAVKLKELGFNEPCFGWFTDSHLRIGFVESKHVQGENEMFAPLYQQAFRWFREKHNIFASIDVNYCYKIYNDDEFFEESNDYNNYEEAELACLEKLIEIVKTLKIED